MPETIYHHKAGTTEYVAVARQLIPLDDATAEGNWGLQGFDEDSRESGAFVDRAGAEAWARWAFRNIEHTIAVDIDRVEWREDVFNDPGFGRVYDAESVVTRRWLWLLKADRAPYCEESYDPQW